MEERELDSLLCSIPAGAGLGTEREDGPRQYEERLARPSWSEPGDTVCVSPAWVRAGQGWELRCVVLPTAGQEANPRICTTLEMGEKIKRTQ